MIKALLSRDFQTADRASAREGHAAVDVIAERRTVEVPCLQVLTFVETTAKVDYAHFMRGTTGNRSRDV